ncbi:unnamed protein product [Lactuca virosa]|nr:unnamed protein product [Lactuca virosa]
MTTNRGEIKIQNLSFNEDKRTQEYGTHIISTVPIVPYIFEYSDVSKVEVQNPGAFTANPKIHMVTSWEPTILATIIIPKIREMKLLSEAAKECNMILDIVESALPNRRTFQPFGLFTARADMQGSTPIIVFHDN